MSDFPQSEQAITPLFVTTYMPVSASLTAATVLAAGISPASITWVANQAVFIPMTIPWTYDVRRVFWNNGSVITSSNADFGIYNYEGTKIYSTGSTALSGASNPQYVDNTDFVLPAGRYYFAYNCDNTTNRASGTTAITTIVARQSGILQQAVGAVTLPSTMASAVAATQAIYPLCGITRTSSGF